MEEADIALSEKMIRYWSNFMKTGDPNDGIAKIWHPYVKEDPYVEYLS